jgi:hypothetical protein
MEATGTYWVSHPGRFNPGSFLKRCGCEANQVFRVSIGVLLLRAVYGRSSL